MKRLRHRLRVLEAAALLTLVGLLIRFLPLQLVVRFLGVPVSPDPIQGCLNPTPAARAVDAAVTAAANRLPWHPVCLPQALTGGVMLRWRGYCPQICFGVQKNGGSLDAHAWLILDDGIVCGGQMNPGFVPFRASMAP